jgi:hypothetical protein
MNREQQTMAALAAAKPEAFDPPDHPDPALRARDLQRILAGPPVARVPAARTGRAATGRRRVATVAVGAFVAAVGIVALVSFPPRQNGQDRAPAVSGTQDRPLAEARTFLLAAAARVERQPASTGAWWYQRERISEVHTFGTGAKTGAGPAYTVEVSQLTSSWSGRSRSRVVTTVAEPRFLTDKDRAAWRAAGSPSLMPGAPPDDTPDRPVKPSVNDSNEPPGFIVGGESLTIDQLQRLPTDPGRLAARLRVAVQELLDNWPTTPGSDPPNVHALVFQAAADLFNRPVTQAVRAAAFEVMAGTDGARLLGPMEDPAGRQGTGITLPGRPEADQVLIVEEATATLLASELVAKDPAHFGVRVPAGTTILSTTWLETGWTDRVGQQP